MTPRVSVITPVCDGREFLIACIESVQAQTLRDWEMLIVDDGSKDDSRDIAIRIANTDSRIKVLHHPNGENRGVSRSRRLALQKSKGEYIALLDADDLFKENKLEHQLEIALQNPDCVLFHTAIHAICDQSDQKSPVDSAMLQEFESRFNTFATPSRSYVAKEESNFFAANHICNSTVFARRETVIRYGKAFCQLFQYEDWTLWCQLADAGRFFADSRPLTDYRVHEKAWTFGIIQNPLKHHYSKIEFLLSSLASTSDQRDSRKIFDHIQSELNTLHSIYRQSAELPLSRTKFEFLPPPPKRYLPFKIWKYLVRLARAIS